MIVKCHQYWPNTRGEPMELAKAQLKVELISEQAHPHLRKLQVRDIRVNETVDE